MTERAILNSALVTVGCTFGSSLVPSKYCGRGELPSVRLMVGTGVTYAGLSIMDDFAPSVARALALTIAVTALFYYGAPILQAYFTGKECR